MHFHLFNKERKGNAATTRLDDPNTGQGITMEQLSQEIERAKMHVELLKQIEKDPKRKLPLIAPRKESWCSSAATTPLRTVPTAIQRMWSCSDGASSRDEAENMKKRKRPSRGSYKCKLCGNFKKEHLCAGSNKFLQVNDVEAQTEMSGMAQPEDEHKKISLKSGRVLVVGKYKDRLENEYQSTSREAVHCETTSIGGASGTNTQHVPRGKQNAESRCDESSGDDSETSTELKDTL